MPLTERLSYKPNLLGNMIWVIGSVEDRGRTPSVCSQRRCLKREREGVNSQSGLVAKEINFLGKRENHTLT